MNNDYDFPAFGQQRDHQIIPETREVALCPECAYDADEHVDERYVDVDRTVVTGRYWYCLSDTCGWIGDEPVYEQVSITRSDSTTREAV